MKLLIIIQKQLFLQIFKQKHNFPMNGDSDIKFSGQRPRFINKNKPPTDDDNGKGFTRAQTAP